MVDAVIVLELKVARSAVANQGDSGLLARPGPVQEGASMRESVTKRLEADERRSGCRCRADRNLTDRRCVGPLAPRNVVPDGILNGQVDLLRVSRPIHLGQGLFRVHTSSELLPARLDTIGGRPE